MLTDINESENPLFKQSFVDTFLERNQRHTEKTVTHPIAKLQKDSFKKEEMLKMRKYADLYGSALPLQYTIERNALANMRRMPPLRSNNNGLKIHTGDYNKVEFKDYLGKNKPFDVDENTFIKVEKCFFN